ncbi:MAG: hypothetical protein KDN22_26395 [Verrucomicrobiae bacterium]|nr:hypothetical protein [Verrucomicrobiae bacterium]
MKKTRSLLCTIAATMLAAIPVPGQAADVVVSGDVTANTTWTSDNVYIMRKPIFVTGGATLTIQPGTTILGGQDLIANTFGSLIITRGCKIMADGTAENPIVFTAELSRTRELTLADTSLWGGVIVLGNAVLNDAGNPFLQPENPVENTRQIEGFPSGGNDANISYGGLDDDDNSGVLRYCSIRYGGFEFDTDEEINGLTLGAVGRGTTIEFIEVFNNSDDGVEFFGGTVNTRFMVMAFNEDESFDFDQGYRGKNQFWFAIQKSVGTGSNYGGEHDGGDSPDKTLEPFARAQVFNATYIGAGVGTTYDQDNWVFRLKDNFAGQYRNSIFTDFKDGIVRIDDDTTAARTLDVDANGVETGLDFDNNTFFGFGPTLLMNGTPAEMEVIDSTEGNTTTVDPQIVGISRTTDKGLDPRPNPAGAAYTSGTTDPPVDGFYQKTPFRGAFGSDLWIKGWTELDKKGYLTDVADIPGTDIVVNDDITTNTVWTSNNAYILHKPIFVTSGATLTIQPGTKIYGGQDFINNTFGSLVITRGSKIMAEGTAENPIIFTAEESRTRELTLADTSLWGGVIILGRAVLNDAGNPFIQPENPVENTREIEGFPSGEGANITYGGLDDDDNSGVMRYCSIQYGGFEFAADEEINGLTLGAVGRGTTIEFIEVFNNSDDGVEFFGGTVNTNHMVMAFNEDESFDFDQGYRGTNQFWFAIQKSVGTGSNYGGEHDGGDSPDKTLEPFARSQVYNATYIGAGVGTTYDQDNWVFRLKDNWAGQYHNSVFTDFKDGIVRIDDDTTAARATTDGDLDFKNNTYFGFGPTLLRNGTPAEMEVIDAEEGNSTDVDPALRGISREAGSAGLDPRPSAGSALFTQARSAVPAGLQSVNYRGAFGTENWALGWTRLDELGYFNREVISVAGVEGVDIAGPDADGNYSVAFVHTGAGFQVYIDSSLNFSTIAVEGTDYRVDSNVENGGSKAVSITILKPGAEQYVRIVAQ